MMMNSTSTELLLFVDYLNSRTEHLKFTMECNTESISFLDVKVHISEGKLQTELFRKPTDRNTILRGDSFHPKPLIKSLHTSQFKRVRRVCSTEESYAAFKSSSDVSTYE